ncbi:hypothetical protein F5884DRAFT_796594 [Xylogone sp. PMI_703]|nr:hypothetical protein F5884DRAFT_796594 [Xylogone sp. PMI_703]
MLVSSKPVQRDGTGSVSSSTPSTATKKLPIPNQTTPYSQPAASITLLDVGLPEDPWTHPITSNSPCPPGPSLTSQGSEGEKYEVEDPLTGFVPDQSMSLILDDIQFGALLPDFVDFAMFMDSVPIPTHPFSPTYQPLPMFPPDLGLPSPVNPESNHNQSEGQWPCEPEKQIFAVAPGSNTTDSTLSQFGSRLPSLQPEDQPPPPVSHQRTVRSRNYQLFVSAECRQQIVDGLATLAGFIGNNFVLPSRHALSRFVAGYFNTFHDHYPFLHVPTLQIEDISVELVLAIAALGARYTREPCIGLELFRAARSIVLERIQRSRKKNSFRLFGETLQTGSLPADTSPGKTSIENKSRIEMIQTVLLLIVIATWYKREPAASDALSLRSVLDALVREDGISRVNENQPEDWQSWVCFETRKRTHLMVYCFFNMHTIAFDIPPMMLASELHIDLPCSEREWKACTEQEWKARRKFSFPQQNFQEAFKGLFSNDSSSMNDTSFSTLGGHVLIHAVIQQIWLVRNTRLIYQQRDQRSLSADKTNIFEGALRQWASYWEQNQESSMDPLSPHGPVSFTSTALLRLAYIRLNLNSGLVGSISSWDHNLIAESFHQSPPLERSNALTRAALHCAHALSVPVKLGINYIARTQVIYWSNQHALCSLECAVLLAKWLEAVAAPNPTPPLTAAEEKLLGFVVHLVAETAYNVSYEEILLKKERLSAITVRIWARLYQFGSVWEMVDLIGSSLNTYADLLEREHQS